MPLSFFHPLRPLYAQTLHSSIPIPTTAICSCGVYCWTLYPTLLQGRDALFNFKSAV